jgi:predicted ATP-grasp superfamily ATP-dependent carboligase
MLKNNAPAIVLSHGSGGLGAVRSLARRGVRVIAIAFEASDPVLHSRFPAQTIVVPGNNDRDKERHVLEILNSLPNNGAVLMATSDRLVSLISDHRNDLHNKFCFKLPAKETLDALNDKSRETELIGSLGFDVPKTIASLPSEPNELEQHLRFPIIFKPHSFSTQDVFPQKNEIVRNHDELHDFYERWQDAIPDLLAQEVITGPDSLSWICSCTFDLNHTLLDCGIKQKLRALPAHFGGSCYAVSRENREILDLAKKLGSRLKYVGHAGIEFRWDNRDQRYKYIELNPRIPANVEFDWACGLPTVWNSYKVSLNDEVVCSGRSQKQGIYYIDLTADLSSLLSDSTPKLKIVTSVISLLFKKTSGQYFAWDDPKPGLVVGCRFISRAFGKVIRKFR